MSLVWSVTKCRLRYCLNLCNVSEMNIIDRMLRPYPLSLRILVSISLILGFTTWTTIGSVSACTSVYHAPSLIMLKSYDWHDGDGDLYFNPKGMIRSAFPHESSTQHSTYSWQSKFSSLTFNQYGRGFPNGGINEKGLVIEVLWLEQSKAVPIDKRPYLNELEWVQFALDTQSSVAELIQASQRLRISPIHGKVHYMTCDASGQCATIESLNGRVVIHSHEHLPYPALTNHSYSDSLDYFNTLVNKPKKAKGSLKRFVVAAQATKQTQKLSLLKALNTLDKVKIEGYTKWQIAYDLRNKEILFRTAYEPSVKSLSLVKLIQSLKIQEGCSAQYTLSLSSKATRDLPKYFTTPKLKIEKSNLSIRFKKLKLSAKLAHHLAEHGARCHDSDSNK